MIEQVHAEYYDSEDPTNRRVNVTIHRGIATLACRDEPSDVWSPPMPLYLDKWTTTPTHERTDG